MLTLKLLWIAIAAVGLQVNNLITKFCPVYLIYNKLITNT